MNSFSKAIFCKRLRELRKEHNLTQAQAADIFGVSRTCYSSWELGQSCPPLEDLFNICFAFQASADYYLGLSDVKKPAPPISIAPAIMPLDPFAGLSPANRESANKYVEFLLTQQEEIERIAHAKDKEA